MKIHFRTVMMLMLAATLVVGCGQRSEQEAQVADAPAPDEVAYRAMRGIEDPAARLEAAEAFLADFPQSNLRPRILGGVFWGKHDNDAVAANTWARTMLPGETDNICKGSLYGAMFDAAAEAGDKTTGLAVANEFWDAGIEDARTLNSIGWTLIVDPEWDPALGARMGDRAAELGDADSRAMYLDTAGWGYYKSGDYPGAKRALEAAVALLTEPDTEFTTHLVAVYEKTGDEDAMFDLIENLLGTCVNTELRAKADAILTKRGGDLKAFDDRLWATRMARATPAPDFELNDLDGKPVKLSDFGGKVLLLNFFFPT